MMYRVRGAIILGILFVSICSWPRKSAVTLFPYTDSGDSAFNFFKTVVGFHKLEKIGNIADYNYGNGQVWVALITFLYVDLFDTTGTLYAMAKFSGVVDPVTKDFERSTVAYCVDAFSISMGSLMGTSPVTAFIESATGISDGGKTGLTAISTSFWFFVAIFFAPIFASIPSYATGGALVVCGSLMIKNVAEINWRYVGDAVPAFLTLIIIPFTYNIAYGLIAGILSFCLINGTALVLSSISRGRIVPAGYYTDREEWSYPAGGLVPVWLRKISRGDRKFWIDDLEDRTANPEFPLTPRQAAAVEPQPVREKPLRDSADETHEKDSVKNLTPAPSIRVVV